jgi:hypothetical protein
MRPCNVWHTTRNVAWCCIWHAAMIYSLEAPDATYGEARRTQHARRHVASCVVQHAAERNAHDAGAGRLVSTRRAGCRGGYRAATARPAARQRLPPASKLHAGPVPAAPSQHRRLVTLHSGGAMLCVYVFHVPPMSLHLGSSIGTCASTASTPGALRYPQVLRGAPGSRKGRCNQPPRSALEGGAKQPCARARARANECVRARARTLDCKCACVRARARAHACVVHRTLPSRKRTRISSGRMHSP